MTRKAESTVLTLPMPPTVNHLYRRGRYGRLFKVAEARAFEDAVWAAYLANPDRRPMKPPVRLEIRFVFGNNRRADADNRIKVCQDAIAKVFGFDDKDVLELTVTKAVEPGCRAYCVVNIVEGK